MNGETDWDDVWELARDVLENGAPFNLTDEMRALLSRAAQQVALGKQDTEDALRGVPTAKALLREINRRIHDGSWRLTDARNRAKTSRDKGDFDGAQQVMRDVLAVEVVPFYREQAEITLKRLVGLAEVLATGRINPGLHDRQQLTALSVRVQRGHALEPTDDLRALLRRTASTAALSETDTEEALKSAQGAETLMGMVLSRFRESERRFLDAMYRMTSLRDSGDLEGARQQMRDVLAVEVVPQYRRMAEEQLRGLDSPPLES
ncbi:DUSAM domain-containing protein [Melittangium boletus]|uniref:DUSAM domain-containing protein n=1 Tax=Melittangium boletus TaxID=83453 RepID=UPI003DA5E9D7